MKLTKQILQALRERKRLAEEARLKELLGKALPAADAELKAAELKLDAFKKELLALNKEKKRIRARAAGYDAKCTKLQEQIMSRLGANFYYDMGRGIRRNHEYNSPEHKAEHILGNLIDSEIIDLQLDCLGKKDDALRVAISAFVDKPLAESAVADTLKLVSSR